MGKLPEEVGTIGALCMALPECRDPVDGGGAHARRSDELFSLSSSVMGSADAHA